MKKTHGKYALLGAWSLTLAGASLIGAAGSACAGDASAQASSTPDGLTVRGPGARGIERLGPPWHLVDGAFGGEPTPAPDAGPSGDTGTVVADAGAPSGAPDAGPTSTPDAGAPGSYPECTGGHPAASTGATTGPVNLVEEQGHGLPGCYRCSLDVADFDGDGRADVVMAGPFDSAWTPGMGSYTYANVVRVYKNVSCPGQEIRFQLAEEIPGAAGGGGAIVKVGDFDGNGLPDFAVQFREGDSPDSDSSGFLNEGAFQFVRRPVGPFDTNSTSMGMAVGDLDRDGRDDLVFNSDAYGSAPGLWYRYDPTTTQWTAEQTDFPHRITYGGNIVAGDLNGDGYPDIVVSGNSDQPFGNYDCSSTLMYGEIHLNRGRADPGIDPSALDALGRFALRSDRSPGAGRCTGSDNAQMMITDVDKDGHPDIIIAGSADGFNGPRGMNGVHYDFVVLRNVDGSGDNYVTFENPGHQLPNGTTNGGSGNLDFPNIAVGDLDGDGFPEVFIQGHHRDYEHDPGAYVFDSRLFHNVGGTSFEELDLGLPDVGEGGQAMADFNLDGKVDLLFTGASIPFHSNGSNYLDQNDASTLHMHVYRNARPQ